jgi:hypothetical protein
MSYARVEIVFTNQNIDCDSITNIGINIEFSN